MTSSTWKFGKGGGLLLAAALTGVAAVSGCAMAPNAADTPVRLVVKDGEKRLAGEPCSGAGPFGDVHLGAEYTVTDEKGEVIANGELPSGVAGKVVEQVDFGAIAEPTWCVFDLVGVDQPISSALLSVADREGIVLMTNMSTQVLEGFLP